MRTSSTCRSTTLRARHLDPYGVDIGVRRAGRGRRLLGAPELAARGTGSAAPTTTGCSTTGSLPRAAAARDDRRPAQWPEAAARARSGASAELETSSSASSCRAAPARAPYGQPRSTTRSGRRPTSCASGRRPHSLRVDRNRRARSPRPGCLTSTRIPHALRLRGCTGTSSRSSATESSSASPTPAWRWSRGAVPFVGFLWRLDTN